MIYRSIPSFYEINDRSPLFKYSGNVKHLSKDLKGVYVCVYIIPP